MAEISGCFETNVTGAEDVMTFKCIAPLIQNILSALLSFIGVGFFIMLLIGGVNYLFAGGDQKKLEKAKGTLTAAIIGLIIIAVSYLILMLISEFTGVSDVLQFNLNFEQ